MAIYTKRGDKGKTSLYDKFSAQRERARHDSMSSARRVSKSSLRIDVIGSVDELNSFLGIVISSSENPKLTYQLKEVQRNLLTIGSILAGSDLRFFKTKTKGLEKVIDEIEGKLPPLKNFILPGGSKLASQLQFARSLTRRVERSIVALGKEDTVKSEILLYLNRLSDYLFMLARDANYSTGLKEEVWVGKKK
ncbi:MAG: cob(I)yrinic acid a,c-diamide adenosyltransferase [Patescibacteria group bacterium]